MHVPTLCDWFSSSASLRLRQPSFHFIVNNGAISRIRKLFSLDCYTNVTPMLLITTPTLLLVKTSLKEKASGEERRQNT